MIPSRDAGNATTRLIGLILGPLFAVTLYLLPHPADLSIEGWRTAALAGWMAIWWMTEAIPLAATSLLPVVVLPLLGVQNMESTASHYAHPLIFLFLGGFLMARAVNVWGLDRRLATMVLRFTGTSPAMIVAAMMAVTAFLSMWVSNTATAMVMLPIGLSIAGAVTQAGVNTLEDFSPALLLGIAYAATIGGIGTVIGTPPNALFVAYMQTSYNIEISFVSWMLIGVPILLVLLPLTWLCLTRVVFKVGGKLPPEAETAFLSATASSGTPSRAELMVAVILTLVAALWITRPMLATAFAGLPISDAGIAITGALLMFILPVNLKSSSFLLDWQQAREIRWDVLLLFGGGLALAAAISNTDLAQWLGARFGATTALPLVVFLLSLGLLVVLIGELASNTAMAAVFLPIAGAVAVNLGYTPITLMLPVALFATLGFMLPVATPPNAIVFGSEALAIRHMLKAGAAIDIMGILVVTGFLTLFGHQLPGQ